MTIKVLVFAGSVRTGSLNERLARHATGVLRELGADVTHASLRDFPLPIYDGDLERESGVPQPAQDFATLIGQHQGVFIACPEYNAGVPPLLKNTLDWVSRLRPSTAFKDRVFGLGSASDSVRGGYRALIHLRHTMELGLGALLQPQMVSVAHASRVLGEDGSLDDENAAKTARSTLEALLENARRFA